LPLSQVSGTLQDQMGLPAAGFRIELAGASDKAQMYRQTQTDSGGRFDLSDVTAGKYVLGVNLQQPPSVEVPYPRTYYPGVQDREQATVVDVPEMSSLVLQPLPLPPRLQEGKIAVQVSWSDGRPATDARVCRETSGDAYCMPMDQVADQPGVYGFVGVEGVEYRISAAVWRGFELPFIVFSETPSYAKPVEVSLADSSIPVRMTLNCEGYPDGRHTCR
jgi:hypothetical protein